MIIEKISEIEDGNEYTYIIQTGKSDLRDKIYTGIASFSVVISIVMLIIVGNIMP